MRKYKYESLEHFAQELFRKRICGSIRIPVRTIEPYLKNQSGSPRDVIRRMFEGYITRYLIGKGMPHEQARLAMGKLCCFKYESDVEVIVTKIGDLQDYLVCHGTTTYSEEIQKDLSAEVNEELGTRRIENVIPDFNEFVRLLTKFNNIIDTGKLAEFYCSILFNLKLVRPRNQYSYDAESSKGERIEIKHRFHTTSIPPGMKINLEEIDYVFYVELERNLLPKKILKINSKDIKYTTGKRVSFKNAFKENRVQVIYPYTGTI